MFFFVLEGRTVVVGQDGPRSGMGQLSRVLVVVIASTRTFLTHFRNCPEQNLESSGFIRR